MGPTTLLYIIRIVNVLWQQETQARNVKDVMERGAKLYEKFAGFVNDMEEIGKSLRGEQPSYEDARNKLSIGDGNLIKQVEMLRQLGVKPRKMLPQKLLESADSKSRVWRWRRRRRERIAVGNPRSSLAGRGRRPSPRLKPSYWSLVAD